MTEYKADILIAGGPARGKALVLDAPISFWGGVDPQSGHITDVRHPQRGKTIGGRVLFLPGTIGSSSASAVLMELVYNKHAPAAIILHEPDAILLLGLIVAREMNWPTLPALRLDREKHRYFAGMRVSVSAVGTVSGRS